MEDYPTDEAWRAQTMAIANEALPPLSFYTNRGQSSKPEKQQPVLDEYLSRQYRQSMHRVPNCRIRSSGRGEVNNPIPPDKTTDDYSHPEWCAT
jgi:hypothetical protein